MNKDVLNSDTVYETCDIQNDLMSSNTLNMFSCSNYKIPQIDGNVTLNTSVSGSESDVNLSNVSLTSGHRKNELQYKKTRSQGSEA